MRVGVVGSVPINSKGYVIKSEDNKHVKYLYNEVQEAIRGQGVSTLFARDFIRMDRMTEALKSKLDSLKVLFTKE